MAEDVSIWSRLLPAEKLGNAKESLINKVDRKFHSGKRKPRKKESDNPELDEEKDELLEEEGQEPKVQAGKILDITI